MLNPPTSAVRRIDLPTTAVTTDGRDTANARRRADLATEARRLDRRRAMAEAVSARCEPGRLGLDEEDAGAVRLRAARRAALLRMRFLRAIDALVLAGGFDEAMAILRQHREGRPTPHARRSRLA